MSNSDSYYLKLAIEEAKKSPCLSRKFGAVLILPLSDKIVIGYNTPIFPEMTCIDSCIRKSFGYQSGHGLEYCSSIHAEMMCLTEAAYNGFITDESSLYVSGCIPCKNCLMALISSGVKKIFCNTYENTYYDELSKILVFLSRIEIINKEMK